MVTDLWAKPRGHSDCASISTSAFLVPGPVMGRALLRPLSMARCDCSRRLRRKGVRGSSKLRRAETCRLKLGARGRKEKGGREREIDYGEVSQVNMENFFLPSNQSWQVGSL